MRVTAILVLALLVPACSSEHVQQFDVTVSNQGTVSARIDLIPLYEIGPLFQGAVQPAGRTNSYTFSFEGLRQVHVQIFNDVDNTQIFDQVWSSDDVRALGFTIPLTVMP